ncbi:hypothetical protein DL93DRAFT_2092824 [Clavulina sp. PMI_390]|nr:hypothetical protein DL93DRAFT_2092824 [Clavulina sp. PMI_390]
MSLGNIPLLPLIIIIIREREAVVLQDLESAGQVQLSLHSCLFYISPQKVAGLATRLSTIVGQSRRTATTMIPNPRLPHVYHRPWRPEHLEDLHLPMYIPDSWPSPPINLARVAHTFVLVMASVKDNLKGCKVNHDDDREPDNEHDSRKRSTNGSMPQYRQAYGGIGGTAERSRTWADMDGDRGSMHGQDIERVRESSRGTGDAVFSIPETEKGRKRKKNRSRLVEFLTAADEA